MDIILVPTFNLPCILCEYHNSYTSYKYYLSSDAGEDEVSAHGVVVGEGHGGVLPARAHPVYVADLKVELTGENVSNSDKNVQIQIQGNTA